MQRVVLTSSQLAALLQSSRRSKKLSQQQVAALLKLSQSRLSELETNAGALTVDRLLEYTKLLGLELIVQKAPPSSSSAATASDW